MINPRLNKDGYPLIDKKGETFRILAERDVWALYRWETVGFGRAKWQRIEDFESYDCAVSYIDVYLHIERQM
jgi:hypothetical protein